MSIAFERRQSWTMGDRTFRFPFRKSQIEIELRFDGDEYDDNGNRINHLHLLQSAFDRNVFSQFSFNGQLTQFVVCCLFSFLRLPRHGKFTLRWLSQPQMKFNRMRKENMGRLNSEVWRRRRRIKRKFDKVNTNATTPDPISRSLIVIQFGQRRTTIYQEVRSIIYNIQPSGVRLADWAWKKWNELIVFQMNAVCPARFIQFHNRHLMLRLQRTTQDSMKLSVGNKCIGNWGRKAFCCVCVCVWEWEENDWMSCRADYKHRLTDCCNNSALCLCVCALYDVSNDCKGMYGCELRWLN